MDRNEILNQVKREIEPQVLEGYFDQILINRVVDATLKAINYSQCCKSDSEQLPTKDDVYSEIKRLTDLYYNDDNVRKSAFGLGFSTGVNFVNKDILK